MKYLRISTITLFTLVIIFISKISCEPIITRYLTDSIEVKWDSSFEVLTGYEMYVQNSSFTNWKNEIKMRNEKRGIKLENPISPLTIENLTSGMSYQIEFEVILSNGTLKEYPAKNFTTKPNKPGFVICNYDGYNINIEWHKPQIYTVFKDYLIIVQGEKWNGAIEVVKMREEIWKTPFTAFHNITMHKSYNVTIQTVSDDKISNPAPAICRTVGPPTNFRVDKKTLTSRSFDIRWEAPKNDSNIDGFEVCIEEHYITKTVPKSGPFVVHFGSDTIRPGHTYEVHVVSVSGYHKSISKIIFITTQPFPVLNLKSSPGNHSDIRIDWSVDKESFQHSYLINYRRVGQSNSSTLVVAHPFINLTGLMAGYNYSIEVVAIFNNISSQPRTIYQCTYPLTPIFQPFVESSQQSIKISWKFDQIRSKRDFFKILWTRLDINQTNKLEVNENTNWADIQDFYPGAKYSIKIFAISNGLASEPDHWNYTVRPLPPNNVDIRNQTNSSLNISWEVPTHSLVHFYNVKVLNSKGRVEQNIKPIHTTWQYIENLNDAEGYTIKLVSISNDKPSNEVKFNTLLKLQGV